MSDIVERARLVQRVNAHYSDSICECEECTEERFGLITPMADEIERLTKENAALRDEVRDEEIERLRTELVASEQKRIDEYIVGNLLSAEIERLRKSKEADFEVYHAVYMTLLHGGSDPYLGALEQAKAIIAERDALRGQVKQADERGDDALRRVHDLDARLAEAEAVITAIVDWDHAENTAPHYNSDGGAHFRMRMALCEKAMRLAREYTPRPKEKP